MASVTGSNEDFSSSWEAIGIEFPDDTTNGDEEEFDEEEMKELELLEIGKAESRAVMKSKVVVYVILSMCALATAIYTWFFVRRDERHSFEDEYDRFADAILKGADDKALTIFRQLEMMSTALSSHAIDAEEVWPYTTLPHFYTRSEELRELAGSSAISFAPVVVNRTAWESFVIENRRNIEIDTFEAVAIGGIILSFDNTHIFPVPLEVTSSVSSSESATTTSRPNFFLPILQYGPDASSNALINMDMYTLPEARDAVDAILQADLYGELSDSGAGVLSDFVDLSFLLPDGLLKQEGLQSLIVKPVFDKFEQPLAVVGFIFAVEPWSAFLQKSLPDGIEGFVVDVHSSCGRDLTFQIDGEMANFIGVGDLHDPRYNDFARRSDFASFARTNEFVECTFDLTVYPARAFEFSFYTSQPYVYSVLVLAVFAATVFAFAIYDWMVRRRQRKVLTKAKQTTEIVQSLFPKEVGKRLIEDAERKTKKPKRKRGFSPTEREEDPIEESGLGVDEPIAEFYPECTIMFADIAGFTAWSSVREPKQVFLLLETVFREFDARAKFRRVFKVETVGDCYVAVAGVPNPNNLHAVAMARFARDSLFTFQVLMTQLETVLGPETTDLALRTGLHSGSVTGGVLRSDRARFQLFGDTMNTASRMESTGVPNKIQISQETAQLLRDAEKDHWIMLREDGVFAKGKGKLQTYWLTMEDARSNTSDTSGGRVDEQTSPLEALQVSHFTKSERRKSHVGDLGDVVKDVAINTHDSEENKISRMIAWNADIIAVLLDQVVAERTTAKIQVEPIERMQELENEILESSSTPMDEMEEVISFVPPFVDSDAENLNIGVDEKARVQLSDYVQAIASMYRDVEFHSFEHASHAIMSLMKLVSRITPPQDGSKPDHTFGLLKNPITHFTFALAALMHDVDHQGVSNAQLVREGSPTSSVYKKKSVAEQNSLDLAWKLLMRPEYMDLRRAIYTTPAEFKFFRQLLLHSILATDIMDAEVLKQRNDRWAKAFADVSEEATQEHTFNLRRTALVESIMQASDVLHTMQHWQIYVKWNQRLYHELEAAYKANRADQSPGEFWYEGEKKFFDFYVVPLATKLRDSGIFGQSSGEFLRQAVRNREEWELKGFGIVEEMKGTTQGV